MSEEYQFVNDIEIYQTINDEQLLDFALSYLSERNSEDETHKVANDIVIYYIIKQFQKEGRESFNAKEVHEQFQTLLADHIINSLVKDEFLEVTIGEDGTEYFSLTDELSEKVKENLDD